MELLVERQAPSFMESVSPALVPPPGNPRFPLLDSIRGASAVAIVLGHSYSIYTGAGRGFLIDQFGQLDVAVQVFFGLSGYLLFRPYLAARAHGRAEPRLRDFMKRRAMRILPAYWFALTVAALSLGPILISGAFSSHWWLYYGFGQIYSLNNNFHGLPTAWSLDTEVGFYLALPAFACLTRLLGRKIGWIAGTFWPLLLLASIGPMVHLLDTMPLSTNQLTVIERITYALPGEINFFAAGMFLVLASVYFERTGSIPRGLRLIVERPMLAWVLAGGCFLFASTVCAFASPVSLPRIGILSFRTRFMLLDASDFVLVLLILIPGVFDAIKGFPQRLLRWRIMAFFGMISYGLYLWHLPLLLLFLRTFPGAFKEAEQLLVLSPLVFLLTLFAGSIAGAASYYLVELPFLRRKLGRRFGSSDVASEPILLGGDYFKKSER